MNICRVWAAKEGNGKVCICAWLIIGRVVYVQAAGWEDGISKGLHIYRVEYRGW